MLRAVALALRARLRELMSLRQIFLIAQPPLLIQGGESLLLNRLDASSMLIPYPRRVIRSPQRRSGVEQQPRERVDSIASRTKPYGTRLGVFDHTLPLRGYIALYNDPN